MAEDPRIGTRLAGYRIDAVVGRGGMGVVYRAEHLHLGRTVALKLLAPELADDAGFRERFIRESRIAAEIDHPNIVTVYDAGEADGLLYIAMRYVEGTDLSSLLRHEGPLPAPRALAILEQVASALDAAHATGLVHRDVKPANILIQGERCYLTDFGLTKRAQAATAFTQTGQFVGTIQYVAPEQIQGADLDARTDVYALGCVLFECLAGAPPFRRDTDVAVVYAHLEEPPPSLSERVEGLPPSLDHAAARALAKRKEDRHPSCSALVDDVRARLDGGAAPAAAPTAVPPTVPAAAPPTAAAPAEATRALPKSGPAGRPPRRRRLAAFAGAGTALAALLLVLVLVLSDGGQEPGEQPTAGEQTGEQTGEQSGEPAAAVVAEQVEVGEEPVGVAIRDGSAWITNSADDTVSRLDARTGEQRGDPIPVGTTPSGITAGLGAVWVANVGDGTVSRFSADTGAPLGPPIEVGAEPRWLALGVGEPALWVSNGEDGTVSRVDTGSGRVTDEIEVGADPRGIGTTRSSVWVANSGDGTLTRIDVGTREADDPVPVGSAPEGIAIKNGVIWVANAGDGTVSRLDNSDGSPLGPPIEVGGVPFAVWVGETHVWVTNGNGTVSLIDPDDGSVVGGPLEIGSEPAGVRADGDLVWVAIRGEGRAMRVRPRR